jgi:hypothetical protein
MTMPPVSSLLAGFGTVGFQRRDIKEISQL